MKLRRLFVASLTALTLLLASCGGSQLEEPLTQEYETIVGEFLSLGSITVDSSITHLFEDEEGNIYYAYSDRYDLDDELSGRLEVAGLVMDYESLDKPALNVTRITEAPEEIVNDTEVTMVNYTDTDLGFIMNYPDNWTFESFRDSIKLSSPEIEPEEEDDEAIEIDIVVVAILEATLRTTSDDEMEARATDVRTQVSIIYSDLGNTDSQVTMIGVDQQFALRYKTESGNVSYFIPQGSGLMELSFYQGSELSPIENSNIFSELVTSFRLLPTGDNGEFIKDEEETKEVDGTEEVEEEAIVEEVEKTEEEIKEVEENDPNQVTVSGFREFESNPYQFKMSYPGSWYYSGESQGYNFATDPIEDDTASLIRMDINSASNTGVVRTNADVQITVEVSGQFYTLIGPKEYEHVMQEMAESIEAVETKEV
ncbi:MAG: hypothetical protein ACI9QC_000854 [Oceanicoccus sp.]|jgi:hypothetical protein